MKSLVLAALAALALPAQAQPPLPLPAVASTVCTPPEMSVCDSAGACECQAPPKPPAAICRIELEWAPGTPNGVVVLPPAGDACNAEADLAAALAVVRILGGKL